MSFFASLPLYKKIKDKGSAGKFCLSAPRFTNSVSMNVQTKKLNAAFPPLLASLLLAKKNKKIRVVESK